MQIIRRILSKIILFFDALLTPVGMQRNPELQSKINGETKSLTLYHLQGCPFCVKVRRHIKRLSLPIEAKDVSNSSYKKELVNGGGEYQVPCLRITKEDGSVQWMYESSDINDYLTNRFAMRE